MSVRLRVKQPRATETEPPDEVPECEPTSDSEIDRLTVSAAVQLLLKQSRELKEYIAFFVAAKTDSVKLRLRNMLLWLVLGVLGFVALAGVFIAAVGFALSGVAGGLGVLFGSRMWLGNLVTGVLVLSGLGLGMYYVVVKQNRAFRNRTIQRYEERKSRQQAEFGHSVSERAADRTATER